MSDIDLNELYNQKVRQFKTMGAGLTRFEDDFLVAVNRTVNRMNRDADLATRISRVSSRATPLGVDEKYEDVVSDGVTLYLLEMGQRPSKGSESMVSEISARFVEGIDMMRQDILQVAQEADTDDSGDYYGLGATG